MAAVVGLTLVKQFAYRANATEEFSNQYWLTGGIPADSTAWKALADAMITSEKTCYPLTTKVVRAYGYDVDTENAPSVWSWDYVATGATVPGTLALSGGSQAPGDCAVWLRWKMGKNNSKGKPIYLRKYLHPAITAGPSGAAADQVQPGQIAQLLAHAAKLNDGTFLSGRVIRAQHWSAAVIGTGASAYVTTRTLKRRGKRPGS